MGSRLYALQSSLLACGRPRRPTFNPWHHSTGGVASGLCLNDGGGCGQAFVKHGQGVIRIATNPFPHPSSFRRRPESRRGGRGMQDGRVYRMPVSGCRYYWHSRAAGMDGLNHWIPRPSFQTRLYHLHPCRRACAGMTARGYRDGDKPHAFYVVIPLPFVSI